MADTLELELVSPESLLMTSSRAKKAILASCRGMLR
jgi:hypothetical protein